MAANENLFPCDYCPELVSCDTQVCPNCGEPLVDNPERPDYEGYEWSDVEADADTLASAGWGTDEDYGDYSGDCEPMWDEW